MNSDDERRLFEAWGWSHDVVGRKWVAPDGYELDIDALVAGVNALGPAVERRLREIIAQHGERPR